jgi:16S rRNA (uracil1498-N3)-methyltransferase
VRLTRVYVAAPLAPGARLPLEGSAAGHLTRVLRLREGAELTLFNGQGGEYAARIDQAQAGRVIVVVGAHRPLERESPLNVTLAQGVSRAERMDLVVQKATELGVACLVPLVTARSVVRLDARQAERKRAHWQAIAIGACEQSGRNRLPQVRAPLALGDFLQERSGEGAAGTLRVLLSPAGARLIEELAAPARAATVLVGPEGGLAPAEAEAAAAAGYTAVRLGPRVLRTETAAIAALTLLQREFGDLRR